MWNNNWSPDYQSHLSAHMCGGGVNIDRSPTASASKVGSQPDWCSGSWSANPTGTSPGFALHPSYWPQLSFSSMWPASCSAAAAAALSALPTVPAMPPMPSLPPVPAAAAAHVSADTVAASDSHSFAHTSSNSNTCHTSSSLLQMALMPSVGSGALSTTASTTSPSLSASRQLPPPAAAALSLQLPNCSRSAHLATAVGHYGENSGSCYTGAVQSSPHGLLKSLLPTPPPTSCALLSA